MADVDHLSYSSVTTYLMCPRSWRFRYAERVKAPVGPALVFGSAFHAAVEQHLQQVAVGGGVDTPADLWPETWREQIGSERKTIEWGASTPEEFAELGMRMLSAKSVVEGLQEIAAKMDATSTIELRCELRVPGVPVPIIGYIDVITNDGIPGDFKTAARVWSQDKAEGETQGLFYLAALNQMGREPPWVFRHYVTTKANAPKFEMFETCFSPRQIMWLFDMIGGVWRAIEAGVFPPNPTGWKCSPKYCEYWHLCRGRA